MTVTCTEVGMRFEQLTRDNSASLPASVDPLLSPSPFLLAEDKLFNLARGGFGQFSEFHGVGALVMRNLVAAKRNELLLRGGLRSSVSHSHPQRAATSAQDRHAAGRRVCRQPPLRPRGSTTVAVKHRHDPKVDRITVQTGLDDLAQSVQVRAPRTGGTYSAGRRAPPRSCRGKCWACGAENSPASSACGRPFQAAIISLSKRSCCRAKPQSVPVRSILGL